MPSDNSNNKAPTSSKGSGGGGSGNQANLNDQSFTEEKKSKKNKSDKKDKITDVSESELTSRDKTTTPRSAVSSSSKDSDKTKQVPAASSDTTNNNVPTRRAEVNNARGVALSNADLLRGLLEHDPNAFDTFAGYRAAQSRAIGESTQVDYSDFDQNLAAYVEWKENHDKDETSALNFKTALTQAQENINVAARSSSYQALLQNIGKVQPGFNISTKESCETIVRFLRSNQATTLTPSNLSSAYQIMLTTDVKRIIDMALTDISRPSYQSNNSLIDKDTKAIYESWTDGQWYKGASPQRRSPSSQNSS